MAPSTSGRRSGVTIHGDSGERDQVVQRLDWEIVEDGSSSRDHWPAPQQQKDDPWWNYHEGAGEKARGPWAADRRTQRQQTSWWQEADNWRWHAAWKDDRDWHEGAIAPTSVSLALDVSDKMIFQRCRSAVTAECAWRAASLWHLPIGQRSIGPWSAQAGCVAVNHITTQSDNE